MQIGRNENNRGPALKKMIDSQRRKTFELVKHYGLEKNVLLLKRVSGKAELYVPQY